MKKTYIFLLMIFLVFPLSIFNVNKVYASDTPDYMNFEVVRATQKEFDNTQLNAKATLEPNAINLDNPKIIENMLKDESNKFSFSKVFPNINMNLFYDSKLIIRVFDELTHSTYYYRIISLDFETNPDGEYLTSFDDLHYTKQNHKIPVKLDKKDGFYYLTFPSTEWVGTNVLKVSKLPHIYIDNFKRKDSDIYRMEYYTDKNNERILFYEFNDSGDLSIESDSGFSGFRPFVYYNIDTGDVKGTDSLFLLGRTFQEGDNAYMDVLFPMILDDLLEMTFRFDFRQRYGAMGLGIYWGDWHQKTVTRLKDATSQKLSWWESILKATLDPSNTTTVGGWIDMYKHDRKDAEHFRNINYLVTENYKESYIKDINKELINLGEPTINSNVFGNGNSMYRVFIDNLYQFGATKFEIGNVTFLNVKYVFEGEYYSVYEDDITSVVTKLQGKSQTDRLLESLLEILKWISANTPVIVQIGLVLLALILLGPIISLFTIIFKSLSYLLKTIVKLPGTIISLLKKLFIPNYKTKNKTERKRY